MAEDPIAGPESGSAPDDRERDTTGASPDERYGPLELTRLHKEDGRALLSYRRPAR